jgi:hypothetical protein
MSKIIKWIHKLIPKSILPTSGEISLGMVQYERETQSKGGTTGTTDITTGETSLLAESKAYGEFGGADSDVSRGAEDPAGSDNYLGEERAKMLAVPYALSAFYGWDWNSCLTVGTNINMADGTTKLVEDLEEGDELLSVELPGMGDVYSDYRIYNLDEVKLVSTKVTQVVFDFSNHYYIINDKFKGTKHPTMAFRNNYYEWWQTKDLLVLDKLVTIDLGLDDIVSVKLVGDEIETVGIRVDKYNTYFAEGYLVHD